MKREDVERMLRIAEGVNEVGVMPFGAADVAALCRRWLAVEDAQTREVEEEMHGLVIRAYPLQKGQRVRIVPEQGEWERG